MLNAIRFRAYPSTKQLNPVEHTYDAIKRQVAAAKRKLANRPDSVSFQEFGLLQADALDRLDYGDAQRSERKELVIAREGDFAITQQDIERNRQRGLEHARKMAQTTPIKYYDNDQPLLVTVKIVKVPVQDSKPDIAVFSDGVPWKFQPAPDNRISSFLLAHDIERHLMLNRDRSANMTNPAGEFLTGQVTNMISAAPAFQNQYDGLIANIACQRMEQEYGSYPFQHLQTMIRLLRKVEIPEGTNIEIDYFIPPPDLVYNDKGPKDGIRRVYVINDGGQINRSGIIPRHILDSAYQNLRQDPDMQETAIHGESGIGAIELTKPCKSNPNFQVCYRFEYSYAGGTLVSGRRFCKLPDGQLVFWAEGMLIKKGIQPVKKEGSTRTYLIKRPNGALLYNFFGKPPSQGARASLHIFQDVVGAMEPIYTGHPYEPVRVQQIRLNTPFAQIQIDEHGARSQKLKSKTQWNNHHKYTNRELKSLVRACKLYQQGFSKYQQLMKEAYEAGTLPLDMVITNTGNTLQEEYSHLLASGHIALEDPKTVETIQRGILARELEMYRENYPDAAEILDQQDLYVALFPPPPFKPEFKALQAHADTSQPE